MECRCSFADKCPALLGILGGGAAVRGGEGHKGNLCSLLNFAVNLKTALKNKVYGKKRIRGEVLGD